MSSARHTAAGLVLTVVSPPKPFTLRSGVKKTTPSNRLSREMNHSVPSISVVLSFRSPSLMATSTSSHSLVNTERTLPPASTRSAGSSPLATAIQCASMTVNNTLIPALPIPGADSFLHQPRLLRDTTTRGQHGAHQDEHEPDAHPGGESLVQDEHSSQSRHRRVDVSEHGGAHRPDLGDQGKEDEKRQRRADDREHGDRQEHARGRRAPRKLEGRQR